MPKVRQLVIVIALSFSIGLHWMLVQSVAWTSMLVTYSQTGTIVEAFKKTFDGKHPCQICRFVTEGQHQEKAERSMDLTKHADPWAAPLGASMIHPPAMHPEAEFAAPVDLLSTPPPFPPPRFA